VVRIRTHTLLIFLRKLIPVTPFPQMKPSRSEFIDIRKLRYHLRQWGEEGMPKLFMLHGWMDMSASFQFLVDSLQKDWHVIAPDWRGFGLSQYASDQSYWFANYVADLDAILEHYSPDEPVYLLGHSMGGDVSSIYAGVRPERVRKLVNLEGYGLPSARPHDASARYKLWLEQLRHPPLPRAFATQAEVAAALKRANPRLSDVRASFLSGHWAAQNTSGHWEILADPMHRNSNPLLYRAEEALACWSGIIAPVLWIESESSDIWQRSRPSYSQDETEEARDQRLGWREEFRAEFERRLGAIPNVTQARITDAGHMVQHDQPEWVARLVEDFLE